jgi:hypothetical protein
LVNRPFALNNFKVIIGNAAQVSSREKLILLMVLLLYMPGKGIPGKQLTTGILT